MLGLTEFVSGEKHGNSLRKKKCGQEVSLLSGAQRIDACIIRGTFDTAVPAFVIVSSVAVLFAISFVVLVVVTDQVAQSETVMGSNEVAARGGRPAIVRVKVAAARYAGRQFSYRCAMSFPESADRVTILSVPLTPKNREVTYLVTARSQVPWFGN